MSEYLEAVSRLNAAGERPPGDNRNYYFPYNVHKYDNASWYNRVMEETGMTKVPKYSVEQRLESHKAFMTANNRKYFNLDPSFTFAHGTRKSIGLRGIKVIDYFEGAIMSFYLVIKYIDKEDKEKRLILQETLVVTAENNISEILEYFKRSLDKQLKEQTTNDENLLIIYFPQNSIMNIHIFSSNHETKFYKNIISIEIYNETEKQKIFCDYFHIKPENTYYNKFLEELTIKKVYHISAKDNLIFKASFVDYTTDNYLGETGQDYSLVNKLYNYREQCPQIWIETYDKFGNPVEFETEVIDGKIIGKIPVGVTYTVELSLICDTNNNMLKDY